MSARPTIIYKEAKLKSVYQLQLTARHNLRERHSVNISHPERQNRTIAGPETSEEIKSLVHRLLMGAGVKKNRANGVIAIEILVSLPADTEIDVDIFFVDVMDWIKLQFKVPLLSAIIHLDENAPHCHYLLLPLLDNRMQGSHLIGSPWDKKARQQNFFETFCKKYGLQRPEYLSTPNRATSNDLAGRILKVLQAAPEKIAQLDVWAALHRQLAKSPQYIAKSLNIDWEKSAAAQSQFVEIMTRPSTAESR